LAPLTPRDLPARLAELTASGSRATTLVAGLNTNATPQALKAAHAALQDASWRCHALASPSPTGCSRHPMGPVDDAPEPGHPPCLLCNQRRRKAERAQRLAALQAANDEARTHAQERPA
jgi:hypothetical protein